MHRTRRFVSGFLQADGIDQPIQLALCDAGLGQHDVVDMGHQVSKDAALPATCRDHALCTGGHRQSCTCAGFDGGHAGLTGFSFTNRPVHGDGLNLFDRVDQALVAQKAQYQVLGFGPQSHQGNEFFFVEVNDQRALGRDGGL